VGEFDDDPPDDGDEVKDSGYTDAESVIDVEIVNPDADAQIMADDPGPITPKDPRSSLSGPRVGQLSITEANETGPASATHSGADPGRCSTCGE